jgi:hypothetical protein
MLSPMLQVSLSCSVFRQGEAQRVNFTVANNGLPVDLSQASIFFAVKRRKFDPDPVFFKEDEEFFKAHAGTGVVSVPFSDHDTNLAPGPYVGEMVATFPGSPTIILKSFDLPIIIQEEVIADPTLPFP